VVRVLKVFGVVVRVEVVLDFDLFTCGSYTVSAAVHVGSRGDDDVLHDAVDICSGAELFLLHDAVHFGSCF
jgi:hypothetical protein